MAIIPKILLWKGDSICINDEMVFEAFQVDTNKGEALNDSYLELFELIGRDAMLKLFTHFHGEKLTVP